MKFMLGVQPISQPHAYSVPCFSLRLGRILLFSCSFMFLIVFHYVYVYNFILFNLAAHRVGV